MKTSIGLVLIAASACVFASQDWNGSNSVPATRTQNPYRTSVSLKTRKIVDKNGQTVFNAPVPLKKKEVKVSKRKSTEDSRPTVSITLQKAREARAKRQAKSLQSAAKAAAHKYKKPSIEFLQIFQSARLNALGSIYLMTDTVQKLVEKYPTSCRFLPANEEFHKGIGTVVCENQLIIPGKGPSNPLGFGPLRVYFQYLVSNDILVGADFEYQKEKESKEKFLQFTETPLIRNESFMEEGGKAVDSPFWRVSRGEDFGRYWTRIVTNFNEASYVEDEKERRKAENVQLGNLQIHGTNRSDLPETTDVCRLLGIDTKTNMVEYFGQCFGFPSEAHYQLNFNDMNKLESLVLRPISVGVLADVAEYLSERFGTGKRCRGNVNSSVQVLYKEEIESLDFHFSYINQPTGDAVIYAGTCERPFVYETPRRVFFTNKGIKASQLEDSYQRRKAANQARINREADRSNRRMEIRNYFNKK